MSRRRLLLVSYFWPPLGGPGVFRPMRMARHLPSTGWDVTVLTVTDRVRLIKDPSLSAEPPPGSTVERTPTLEPRDAFLVLNRLGLRRVTRAVEPWFMIPDDQIGWVPFATRRARAILGRAHHDAVLTTSSPYSAHLVGRALHRSSGIPWAADFRDEWTTNPYLRDRYPTRWHLERNRRLERAVLGEADRVTCVSRPWLDTLRSLVPGEKPDKFAVLPNGWDAGDFPGPPPAPPDRFRIVYTGMFYGFRSPRTFLEGLRAALASGQVPARDLEVVFMGHTDYTGELAGIPRELVRIVEQRPYADALSALHEAAVLLLFVPVEGGPGNHTGKLFPYLASGRPILALAPEPNVAADVIRESRSGLVVPPDDPRAVADALAALYRRWRSGSLLPDQDRSVVDLYEARPQARALAALLDDLVRSRCRPEPDGSVRGFAGEARR